MTDERLSEAEIGVAEIALAEMIQRISPYPTAGTAPGVAQVALRAIRQLRADLKLADEIAHDATAELSRAAEAAGLAPYGGAWNPEALVPAIMSLRAKAEQFDSGAVRVIHKPLPSPTWEDDR